MEYTAAKVQQFLQKLGFIHRKTSVGFPNANQKAERSVAAAKRVIRDAGSPTGDLDTVKLVKGLLQLRNRPDPDTGLLLRKMMMMIPRMLVMTNIRIRIPIKLSLA